MKIIVFMQRGTYLIGLRDVSEITAVNIGPDLSEVFILGYHAWCRFAAKNLHLINASSDYKKQLQGKTKSSMRGRWA